MEIVADLECLNKMFNAGGLGSLCELFGNPTWLISPSAFREMKKYKNKDENLFSNFHIHSPKLEYRERELISKWRKKIQYISKKEIEAIAIAKNRGIRYLVYESHGGKICSLLGVQYMNLPMALKALWAKKIITKKQVWEIINNLEKNEKIKFDDVDAIFAQN